MLSGAPSTARLFLVHGLPSSLNGEEVHGDALSFTELPPLPISSPAAGGAQAARPLVSPMLHLGRRSPLLCTALRNDRQWSRKLFEVTTWCIEGLALNGGLCPVDAASLPFAGVRLRLCGRGGDGPVCVRSRGAGDAQRVVALTEPGACAWLRHGDTVEFGKGGHLHFLVVHVRTGLARDLAANASFLWVQPKTSTGGATPVAMWAARFGEWSAVPRYLKIKMLAEAAHLAQLAMRDDEARWRRIVTASTKAPSSDIMDKGGASQRGWETAVALDRKRREGCSLSPPLLANGGDNGGASSQSSATRPDASAEGEVTDVEAATPNSPSQQLQQRARQRVAPTSPNSQPQQLFLDHRQTRSAPDVLMEGRDTRSTVLAMQPSSQGRSPPLQRGARSPHSPRPLSSLRTSISMDQRYTAANLSETLDDKLQEALLNLENGGNEVGQALVAQKRLQQQRGGGGGDAEVLGALEDDLTKSRVSSAGMALSHPHHFAATSLSTRWEDEVAERQQEVDEEQEHGRRSERGTSTQRPSSHRTTNRGGRGKAAHSHGEAQGRRSGSNRCIFEGEGDVLSRRRRRRTLSASLSLSQPQQRDDELDGRTAIAAAAAAPPPPLTRANIKRQRTRQAAQEDSQVVYFEH